MELLLNIYDDQTGETENKVIPDPDDATIWNTLRQVVEQATEEPDKDVIVGLYPADEAESIAFYILQDEPWKERSAPPGERDEEPPPLPPPVPGEEASSSPALPEWRCHVEYSRAGNDGRKKEFVTEELKLPDVLKILQHYAKGDRGWQERPEWQAKGTVAAVAETATLDGDSGCGIIYLVIVAFFIIWGIANRGCGDG